eukprot:6402722-Prymnesium_polylepis.1
MPPQSLGSHRCCNSARLDRIAQRSSRAVRLTQGERILCNLCISKRRTQQPLLRLAVGRRQARAPPVLPHRAPHQPSAAISSRHADRARALTASKPVRSAVKRVRAACERCHACDRHAHTARLQQHQVDPNHQMRLALATLQRTRCRVTGDERCRACRLVRRTRALQSQHERHAAARNRQARSGAGIHTAAFWANGEHLPKLGRVDADRHASAAAQQLGPAQSVGVQCCIAALQHQSLLRVCHRRLCQRHVEGVMVKQLRAVHKGAVPAAVAQASIESACQLARAPSCGGHLAEQIARHGDGAVERGRRRHAAWEGAAGATDVEAGPRC